MSFKYDKTNLFKEFEVAKNKDIALSKLDTLEEKENDVYKNRIQFLKEHIELKKTNPEYYSGLDINFEKLLEAWSSTSPIDYFYNAVFGMSYAEKMRISEIELAEKRAEVGLGD